MDGNAVPCPRLVGLVKAQRETGAVEHKELLWRHLQDRQRLIDQGEGADLDQEVVVDGDFGHAAAYPALLTRSR